MSKKNEYYKKTEARLYLYQDIKTKLENDILDLNDLKKEKITGKSKDILYRSVAGGIRLSPEELQEIKINSICESIKKNTREISAINDALNSISTDPYANIIPLKYMNGKTDEKIAEEICCDPSTVRRNRKRLVQKISVRLYGVDAILS